MQLQVGDLGDTRIKEQSVKPFGEPSNDKVGLETIKMYKCRKQMCQEMEGLKLGSLH
jgi:hypothetical protein